MIDEIKYMLLDIINKNASINQLTREGLSYTDIVDYTNKLTHDGLISANKNELVLTNEGLKCLIELSEEFKKTKKENWIEKDLKNKIPKIEKKAIFLPRQDELTFLLEQDN